MRYFQITLIVLLQLFSLASQAQEEVLIKKKDFMVSKQGFNEAWDHLLNGNAWYKGKGALYGNAYDEYLKAIDYNDSNAGLNYRTGVSALLSDHGEDAAAWLLKALDENPNVAGDILLMTGRALQYKGEYNEAVARFEAYLASNNKKTDLQESNAKKYIGECNSASRLSEKKAAASVENIGPSINSAMDDYAPVLSADGTTLYFASRRHQGNTDNEYKDSKPDENILTSKFNNGSWSRANSAGKDITTTFCETPLWISRNGDSLFIYAGYEKSGDIMVSVSKRGKWGYPVPASFGINSNDKETSFAVAPDGKEIAFIREGGKSGNGGKDVYFISRIRDKKWSKPVNPGQSINTAYDEESVSYSRNGDTLYFSSKGHNTIGGFDIFMSVRKGNGVWGEAENMGIPVNSQWDDFFFREMPYGHKEFILASNRSGGYGWTDIYEGRFTMLDESSVAQLNPDLPSKELSKPLKPVMKSDTVNVSLPLPGPVKVVEKPAELTAMPADPVVKPKEINEKPLSIALGGRIRDVATDKPLEATIEISDLGTSGIVASGKSNASDGSYKIAVPARKPYRISVSSGGYNQEVIRVIIPSTWQEEVYVTDISLGKHAAGQITAFETIYFEGSTATMLQASKPALARDLEILKNHPEIKIEISGHHEKMADEPNNFRISEARAVSVKDYFVKNGIDESRIEVICFGSLKPAGNNLTPEGRAKNRRVEIKLSNF